MIVFKGSRGVRAGWRFLLFLVLLVVFDYVASSVALFAARALHASDAWMGALAPLQMCIEELTTFTSVVGATFVLARLEKHALLDYGFAPSPTARPQFFEGVGLGVVSAALVAVLMLAFGGMQIHGFGLTGGGWVFYPLGWLVVMLLVGFAEEALFRGYALVALARGIGFWPAAIVMTLLFGLSHVGKPGENAVDIASVMLLGLFTCYALWKTGSLWLAAGFHAAFDFMQFFVIGTRNGSQAPEGTLFNASFPGPAWINGGPLGTEASAFIFPAIVALAAYVAWRYRGAPRFTPPTSS
ncbi:MAG: CPBP family intramembrane metalloprotease [bacterium]|nr:CPBP family intramembrane metalloprotease [bacterium]